MCDVVVTSREPVAAVAAAGTSKRVLCVQLFEIYLNFMSLSQLFASELKWLINPLKCSGVR